MVGKEDPSVVVDVKDALPGRSTPVVINEVHAVNGRKITGAFGEGKQSIVFTMGCFWTVEPLFWDLEGVWITAVGYTGGTTPNPTHEEVRSGKTGHAMAILVVYDPNRLPLEDLLKVFWENHDPTQNMQHGEELGPHYRSGIYTTSGDQMDAAKGSRFVYQTQLASAGLNQPKTVIEDLQHFYYAEDADQQYAAKNSTEVLPVQRLEVDCPIGSKT